MTEKQEFMPLRKTKQAVPNEKAWEILESQETAYGFLGTHGTEKDNEFPYTVPMNFAADRSGSAIYLHTTIDEDSKRNAAVAERPDVCFSVVHPDAKVLPSEEGLSCKYSMSWKAVIAYGNIEKVEEPEEKTRILNFFMDQKAKDTPHKPVEKQMTYVATIYRINVLHISGSIKE